MICNNLSCKASLSISYFATQNKSIVTLSNSDKPNNVRFGRTTFGLAEKRSVWPNNVQFGRTTFGLAEQRSVWPKRKV